MIFLIYNLILGFIIPFLMFILPYILEFFLNESSIPIDLILNILIPIIVAVIFYFYHLHNTSVGCETTNKYHALSNSAIVFGILLTWIMALEYFPSILSPFKHLISETNPIVDFLAKNFMILAVVFILMTYTSFNSIKETCKVDIKTIKQVYQRLEKELK